MINLLKWFHAIEKDKLQHFVTGLLAFMLCAAAMRLLGLNVWWALGVVALLGIGKEGYDAIYNKYIAKEHTVDRWDAVATFVGGLAGMACYLLPLINLA